MAAFIWRIIIAVLAFAFFWAIIPPVLDLLGLSPSAALLQILRICSGALAFVYIIWGPAPVPPWSR